MKTITDVYLEKERFNPVTGCTIPAAWVAIVDGTKQAFAREFDFISENDAFKYAAEQFADYD